MRTPRPVGGHSIHETSGVLPPSCPLAPPKPAPVPSPLPPGCSRGGDDGAGDDGAGAAPPARAGSPPPLPARCTADPSPVVRPAPPRPALPRAARGSPRSRRCPVSGMVMSVLAGVCLAATLAMFATGL